MKSLKVAPVLLLLAGSLILAACAPEPIVETVEVIV